MRIGVDLISGESAMENLVEGCIDAVLTDREVEVSIFGQSSIFKPILDQKRTSLKSDKKVIDRISIVESSEVITMNDDPLTVIKQKKDSSIIKGLQAHKNKEIDAFFSPGNTGAIVVAASLILGRVKGLKKPALATYMPNIGGNANILLDVGASAECEAEDYLKFAIMGDIYSRELLHNNNPRIGLLNIGEEEHKGTSSVKAAYKKISESYLNFIGNVEGRDIFSTDVDVIVCDGHIGNIALKTAEGAGKLFVNLLKQFIKSDLLASISVPLYKGALKKLLKSTDPEQFGGAPLLGVNGNVYIGHGSSGRDAIKYGILAASHAVKSDVLGKINRKMKDMHLA